MILIQDRMEELKDIRDTFKKKGYLLLYNEKIEIISLCNEIINCPNSTFSERVISKQIINSIK